MRKIKNCYRKKIKIIFKFKKVEANKLVKIVKVNNNRVVQKMMMIKMKKKTMKNRMTMNNEKI